MSDMECLLGLQTGGQDNSYQSRYLESVDLSTRIEIAALLLSYDFKLPDHKNFFIS